MNYSVVFTLHMKYFDFFFVNYIGRIQVLQYTLLNMRILRTAVVVRDCYPIVLVTVELKLLPAQQTAALRALIVQGKAPVGNSS